MTMLYIPVQLAKLNIFSFIPHPMLFDYRKHVCVRVGDRHKFTLSKHSLD